MKRSTGDAFIDLSKEPTPKRRKSNDDDDDDDFVTQPTPPKPRTLPNTTAASTTIIINDTPAKSANENDIIQKVQRGGWC